MSRAGDWTLCVDFGTAFSKAAAAPSEAWVRFDPEWVRPLMLGGADAAHNAFLLESAVFVGDDRVLFGGRAAAAARAGAQSGRAALRSFKTLLSVSDLDRALNTAAPAAVDPHRMFTLRDLVTLYLAYLLASIERAINEDDVLSDREIGERRYAAPAWRSGDSAGLHNAVLALFAEAEIMRGKLGKKLLDPAGLSFPHAEKALAAASGAGVRAEMGLIFEASAAASYAAIGLERSAAHMVVVDIGAGTTDIAALHRSGARVRELPRARVTLRQAGDFVDHVIANLALAGGAGSLSPEEKTALWNLIIAQMVDIKESMFYDGRAVLRHRNRTYVIQRSALERDSLYRDFAANLTHAFDHSLQIARRHARREGRGEIQVIAVGGGSSAPFVREMLSRAAAKGQAVAQRPSTPEWAQTVFEGNLAPVFPQLAIAIGGALAPPDMLAVGGDA
jgi:molecular chaperone DnaK (HSP70)